MTRPWLDSVTESITTVIGADGVRELTETWQGHARRPSLVVTVHGPLDAGKSTLIKRMLVADETPVPDWLIISGRRETMTVSSVESRGVTWVDTPGTAGGNADHDELAAAAVCIADAIVLVITPQLLADDAIWIRSFAAGTFYSPSPAHLFPDGALLLVIAQADTMGIDPTDSPDGFRALCERKRGELAQMLALDPEAAQPSVHLVAADPYGIVGNDPAPTRDDYHATDWDGLPELRAELAALREHLSGLRESGQQRYWLLQGKRAAETARQAIDELEPLLEEARSRQARRRDLLIRLDALDESVISDLKVGLSEELNGLINAPAGDETGLRMEAERRLQDRLEAWYAGCDRRIVEFATEAETEFIQERIRPSSQRFDAWLSELGSRHRPGTGYRTSATEFTQSVKAVASGAAWLKYGMTLDNALDALDRKNNPGKYRNGFGNWSLPEFRSDEAVASARKWLPKVETGLQALNAVAEFGPMVFGAVRRYRANAAENKRRERAREEIAKITQEIEDRVLGDSETGWHAAIADIRTRLQTDPWLEPLAVQTRERINELTTAHTDLLDLLVNPPLKHH